MMMSLKMNDKAIPLLSSHFSTTNKIASIDTANEEKWPNLLEESCEMLEGETDSTTMLLTHVNCCTLILSPVSCVISRTALTLVSSLAPH